MNHILTDSIQTILLNANAKALATTGPNGLNVVPVSTIKIIKNQIILVDYFFNKTRTNLEQSENLALVGWSGPTGWQIKGNHQYKTDGDIFKEITQWARETFPERTVCGVVVITATEVCNISL